MRITHLRRSFGVLAVVALVATACSDDDPGPDPTGTETPTATDVIVSTEIGEPRFLDPLNSSESEGIAVIRTLFTPLIEYDPQTSEPILEVAASIESEDEGLTWKIVLNDGWTFHDGTAVTAASFVDAWNHGAHGPNAAQNAGFFADIAGYSDLQCGTREATQEDVDAEIAAEVGDDVVDCDAVPASADTLSGLVVDSELEFTVTLGEAQTFWSEKLGYPAYSPLPEAYYADPQGFNEAPIGNGPFMMDGAWEHDVEINVVRYDDFAGTRKPTIGGISWLIYADRDTATTDLLAGNFDIQYRVGPERWEEVQAAGLETGEGPSSSINYLGFPSYQPAFADPEIRAALSMAIDRQAITTAIFNDLRQPAFNLLAPVIPGYQETVCDEWSYNPEEAKARFDAAGGIDGPLEVWFNAGAGHDDWVEAVVNQWGEVLGIDVEAVEFRTLEFAEYLDNMDQKTVTGPFRLGWGMDYPHPQNYLELLLASYMGSDVGGANSSFYASEEYDAKLREALTIADLDEAIPVYQEAVAIACADAPLAPMFYGLNTYAWNDTVSGVFVDAFTNVDWYSVRATG